MAVICSRFFDIAFACMQISVPGPLDYRRGGSWREVFMHAAWVGSWGFLGKAVWVGRGLWYLRLLIVCETAGCQLGLHGWV